MMENSKAAGKKYRAHSLAPIAWAIASSQIRGRSLRRLARSRPPMIHSCKAEMANSIDENQPKPR
jgi:hypothetical protein